MFHIDFFDVLKQYSTVFILFNTSPCVYNTVLSLIFFLFNFLFVLFQNQCSLLWLENMLVIKYIALFSAAIL